MSKNQINSNNNPSHSSTLTNFLKYIKSDKKNEIDKPSSKILLIDDNFSYNDLIIPELLKNSTTINTEEDNINIITPKKNFSPIPTKNNSLNYQPIFIEDKEIINIDNKNSSRNLVDNYSQTINISTNKNLYDYNNIIKKYKINFNKNSNENLPTRKTVFMGKNSFGKSLFFEKKYSYSVKELNKEKYNIYNMNNNLLKYKENKSNYFLLNKKLSDDNFFRTKPKIKIGLDEDPTESPIKSLLSERLQIQKRKILKPILEKRNICKIKQINLKIILNTKLNSEKEKGNNDFFKLSPQNYNQQKILSSFQKSKKKIINKNEKFIKFQTKFKTIYNVNNNILSSNENKSLTKYIELKIKKKKLIGSICKKNYNLSNIKLNKLIEFFNKSK